jgi:hypothetical protein
VHYFVLTPDGQRYGPADVQTLAVWASEGRVLPTSILENVQTLERLPANAVLGQAFATSAPPPTYGAPPSFANYPRPAYLDSGSREMSTAWTCAILSIFGCMCYAGILLGPIAIWQASIARKKGATGTLAVIIVAAVGTVLSFMPFIGVFLRPSL